MHVYAGIDEAGYGPMFGPLLVGRAVLGMPDGLAPAGTDGSADVWAILHRAVCRNVARRKGRIPVNDSKKLRRPGPKGVQYLELGTLSFAGLAGHGPEDVGQWLGLLGDHSHQDLEALPWYAPAAEAPWEALPGVCTGGEIAVARNMLMEAAAKAQVKMLDLGAAVVFEDRFNRMVAATRSKASASFTFVAAHLEAVWRGFGACRPTVVVDRQSGRTRYRELLAQVFPAAEMQVVGESPSRSVYRLTSSGGDRSMTVRFEVDADGQHLPVALASMLSKYTRELLMHRFQRWFQRHAPDIKPTAGYARDAQRFWKEIQPTLERLGIDPGRLRRML